MDTQRAVVGVVVLAVTGGVALWQLERDSAPQSVSVTASACSTRPSTGIDESRLDDIRAEAGQISTVSEPGYAPGSTDALLAQSSRIALLTVAERDLPRQLASAPAIEGATQPGADYPLLPVPPSVARVVRRVTFETTRTFKGMVPSCITFDVPGGSAGAFRTVAAGFPARLRVGDRVLALLEDHVHGVPGLPWAGEMLPVAADGTVRFPFGGGETVDVDTWMPSPLALTKPKPPPAAGCGPAGCVPPPP